MRLIKNDLDFYMGNESRQKTLNALCRVYKIDQVYLEFNNTWFTSYEGLVLLGARKTATRLEPECTQAGLIDELFRLSKIYSYTELAAKLKLKRMCYVSFFQRLRATKRLNVPFLISIGVGIRLMQLLDEDLKHGLINILSEMNVAYELGMYDSRNKLAWGD